ncbi:MAG TPA: lipoate--protein ligase family protein [Geobacteraceae bacterium]
MSAPLDWRLIDTGPLDGPTNMAVDEALLACFDPERSAPVLRLYGWAPPALSLGRFQDAAAVLDLERCAAAGVPVVRRITGGGVIYHAAELTYALVCAPHQLPPARSVKESFRILTGFLLRFYSGLGLSPCYAVDHAVAGTRFGERTPFCFAGKESYDILVSGRKLGGNAQRRLRNAIFQHGSVPLANHARHGSGFLREPPEEVGESSVSLGELGIEAPEDSLRQGLAEAFATDLGVVLERDSLSDSEQAQAERLRREKYAVTAWNRDGIEERDRP